MDLYIKNMVCSRCKMVVWQQLEALHFHPVKIVLGEVEISEKEIPLAKKIQLNLELQKFGFELMDDKKSRLIEKIKTAIIQLVRNSGEQPKINFSGFISSKLNHDYSYLSNLFSEVEGTTIEQYYIAQKIERVKELIVYDEVSLNEISFQLGYSSVSHLSKQFKKVTGLSPSHFKKLKDKKRKPIEEL